MTFAVFEPEAVAVHLEDMDVMGKAIEQRAGQSLGAEHSGPLIEGQVAGDDDRAAFVALAEDLEQQLGASRRERHVAQLVDDQQLQAGELALQTLQTLFVPRFVQFVNQVCLPKTISRMTRRWSCGNEADRRSRF